MTDFNKLLVGLSLNEAEKEMSKHPTKYMRIMREGAENIITADFKPDQLEVWVDENGTVVRVE